MQIKIFEIVFRTQNMFNKTFVGKFISFCLLPVKLNLCVVKTFN